MVFASKQKRRISLRRKSSVNFILISQQKNGVLMDILKNKSPEHCRD